MTGRVLGNYWPQPHSYSAPRRCEVPRYVRIEDNEVVKRIETLRFLYRLSNIVYSEPAQSHLESDIARHEAYLVSKGFVIEETTR